MTRFISLPMVRLKISGDFESYQAWVNPDHVTRLTPTDDAQRTNLLDDQNNMYTVDLTIEETLQRLEAQE